MRDKAFRWWAALRLTWFGGTLVVLALVGLGLVLGDLPWTKEEQTRALLIRTSREETHSDEGPKFLQESSGWKVLALQEEQLNMQASLPVLPWQSAKISGRLHVSGIAVQPGEVRLWVMLPPGSQVEYVPTGGEKPYRWHWRLLAKEELASRGYEPDSGSGTLAALELLLEFDRPCVEVRELFEVATSDSSYSHGLGWGRQTIRMGYQPLGRWDENAAARRAAVTVCKTEQAEFERGPGFLFFHPQDRQRVTEFSPTPSEPAVFGLVWNIPTDSYSTIGLVEVENVLARFAVEQGAQLLYLVIGVLLGTIGVRASRRNVD